VYWPNIVVLGQRVEDVLKLEHDGNIEALKPLALRQTGGDSHGKAVLRAYTQSVPGKMCP